MAPNRGITDSAKLTAYLTEKFRALSGDASITVRFERIEYNPFVGSNRFVVEFDTAGGFPALYPKKIEAALEPIFMREPGETISAFTDARALFTTTQSPKAVTGKVERQTVNFYAPNIALATPLAAKRDPEIFTKAQAALQR